MTGGGGEINEDASVEISHQAIISNLTVACNVVDMAGACCEQTVRLYHSTNNCVLCSVCHW